MYPWLLSDLDPHALALATLGHRGNRSLIPLARERVRVHAGGNALALLDDVRARLVPVEVVDDRCAEEVETIVLACERVGGGVETQADLLE